LIPAEATSIKPAKVSTADEILDNFTKREQEALEEYYRKKFQLQGRSTSSKSIFLISDMHCGNQHWNYVGTSDYRSPTSERLLDVNARSVA
jgi:hypothetical protein